MDNPAIYDRCLNCGTPLPEITHPGMDRYLLPAIIVVMVVLVTGFLIIPALHISMASGRDLSTAINGVSATPTPVPEYQINQPARVGDLQVTVTDTRPGVNQFNDKRFYTVTLSVQNFNSNDTYTLSATDFTLADARENYYSSLGIQSKPSVRCTPWYNRCGGSGLHRPAECGQVATAVYVPGFHRSARTKPDRSCLCPVMPGARHRR